LDTTQQQNKVQQDHYFEVRTKAQKIARVARKTFRRVAGLFVAPMKRPARGDDCLVLAAISIRTLSILASK